MYTRLLFQSLFQENAVRQFLELSVFTLTPNIITVILFIMIMGKPIF